MESARMPCNYTVYFKEIDYALESIAIGYGLWSLVLDFRLMAFSMTDVFWTGPVKDARYYTMFSVGGNIMFIKEIWILTILVYLVLC